jgi:predicted nucleotidyltransferase component of viral defense system
MKKWNQQTFRDQLIKKSKELGLRLPQMQMLLTQERFLARLFSLSEGKFFVWKGGSLLIRKYSSLEVPRYTVDIDLLLKGTDYKNTVGILKKACHLSLDDGFEFSQALVVTPMERQTPYGGDGYEIQWTMFGKNQSAPLRIDICTGDVVEASQCDFYDLALVPDDDLHISASIYPPEFIFAEKLETVFRFATGNTRCKDLIDLWTLSKLSISKSKLKKAVEACFENRNREFSMKELQEILEDDFFVKNIERMAKSKFSYLNLPSMTDIIKEILIYCKKLFG